MELRNEIFAHVYDWLCQHKGVDGQKDLSRITGISQNTLTNILNGKTKVSDKTLHKLNSGFDFIFNMQYLRGADHCAMLVNNMHEDSTKESENNENEKAGNPPIDELSANINALELLTQMIRRLDDARIELQHEIHEVRQLKAELHEILSRLQSSGLDNTGRSYAHHDGLSYDYQSSYLLSAADPAAAAASELTTNK